MVTINSLAAISADRYWAVVWRSSPSQKLSKRVMAIVLSSVWGYSVAWALCPLLGWGNYILDGIQTTCTFDYLTRSFNNRSFVIAMSVGNFIFPLLVMTFSYTKIWLTIREVKTCLEKQVSLVSFGSGNSMSLNNCKSRSISSIDGRPWRISIHSSTNKHSLEKESSLDLSDQFELSTPGSFDEEDANFEIGSPTIDNVDNKARKISLKGQQHQHLYKQQHGQYPHQEHPHQNIVKNNPHYHRIHPNHQYLNTQGKKVSQTCYHQTHQHLLQSKYTKCALKMTEHIPGNLHKSELRFFEPKCELSKIQSYGQKRSFKAVSGNCHSTTPTSYKYGNLRNGLEQSPVTTEQISTKDFCHSQQTTISTAISTTTYNEQPCRSKFPSYEGTNTKHSFSQVFLNNLRMKYQRVFKNRLFLKQHQYRLHCEKKTMKVILFLLLAFLISWCPYVIISLIGLFGEPSGITYFTSVLPSLLAKTSMVFNPILYSISHPKVRKRIMALFREGSCLQNGNRNQNHSFT